MSGEALTDFAVILPQTNGEGAVRVAERIQKSNFFARYRAQYPETHLGVTFGINSTVGKKQLDAQKFIDRADKALLRAKRKGTQRIGLVRSSKVVEFF